MGVEDGLGGSCTKERSLYSIGGKHSFLARVSVHQVSCLMRAALLGVASVPLLLRWNLYRCSRLLARASACLQDGSIIHMIAAITWGSLCRQCGQMCKASRCVQPHVDSQWSGPGLAHHRGGLVKRCLLCCCWGLMTFLLSMLSVLDQTGKAVPGFFCVRERWTLRVISASIGAIQSAVIKLVIPWLAQGYGEERDNAQPQSSDISCFDSKRLNEVLDSFQS